jgi:oxygen-independent coproporphyrinogen-3 oxidase
MNEPVAGSVRSLYIHVPFCARKCDYCAFYSEPTDGGTIQRYVHALIRELEMVAPDLRPATVFFGGGTPSLLTLRQWEEILHAFDRLGLMRACEWTVECNPATISMDKAHLWRDHGINRISLGVQSLDESLLDRLGRIHSRAAVFQSVDLLRRAGFANLNLDLMFGIPGQTMETWQRTLDEAMAFGSEHLACYEVTYEEDTPLFEQLKRGAVVADDDLVCAMYEELVDRAGQRGFARYEVSNFARTTPDGTTPPGAAADEFLVDGGELPGYACRHNVNYWRGGSFHGLGPSASGYVGGVRTKNWPNTTLYCEQLEQGRRAFQSCETLPPRRRAGEIAAFGLRMAAGWPFARFRQTTGFDLMETWGREIDGLIAQGWGRRDAAGFRLTDEGMRFADAAAEQFIG